MVNKAPKHIAIIMDGNGRWATERGLSRLAGHKAGLRAVREVIESCADVGVDVLSLFAFSSENWGRPAQEVSGLMALFHQTLQREIAELHAKQVVLRFIGERDRLSNRLLALMESSEKLTAKNKGLTLVVALDYGGSWDVMNACRQLLDHVVEGRLSLDGLREADLRSYLTTGDLPDPDLFIRTSGEQRLSNFYLMQLAYTELYFYPQFWPDFGRSDLMQAIKWYHSRERRYGNVTESIRTSKCLDND